jgi:hypothetical protein
MDPRKTLRIGLFVPFLAIGCFNPSPPAGAYRCSAADSACPLGQHCTCGLCVYQDNQAACGFQVATAMASLTVNEHQQFPLTVQALMADGKTPAASFNGTVSLASSWGDVKPTTITLKNGAATANVSLNRETLPPQTATVSASFAGNKGTSGKITVKVQPFVRDANAIAPPASTASPYGFADVLVAQPDLVRVGGAWRMYFGGYSGVRGSYSFGLATSTDGVSFTPLAMPIFDSGAAAFDKGLIISPSVFESCTGFNLAFEAQPMARLPSDKVPGDVGLATSPDGLAPFALAAQMPVLNHNDCGYCGMGLEFPGVIRDPAAPTTSDGGCSGGWIMFFSAIDSNNQVTIDRAGSSDGINFTAEPAPLLSGNLSGEAVLLSPRVIVDGTVFKMFYTFARVSDIRAQGTCESFLQVGYATSSDGFYWIRSPSNPVMTASAAGWDATTTAFLVGSVVPTDGNDAQNGLSLYYSTFRHLTLFGADQCLPNGIGRATRP